jgi:hypothetical protein
MLTDLGFAAAGLAMMMSIYERGLLERATTTHSVC